MPLDVQPLGLRGGRALRRVPAIAVFEVVQGLPGGAGLGDERNDAHFAAAFFANQRVGFEHTADQVGLSAAKGFTLGGVELVVVERAFDGSQHVELAAL